MPSVTWDKADVEVIRTEEIGRRFRIGCEGCGSRSDERGGVGRCGKGLEEELGCR